LAEKIKAIGRNWYHFFDYQHLIKNLRNLLFNEDLETAKGSKISVDGLMEAKNKYNNIPEIAVKRGDRMK
jgi:hypothetical protein